LAADARRFAKLIERWHKFVSDDSNSGWHVVEVEAGVEGHVQLASRFIGRLFIQVARLRHQVQSARKPLGSEGQFCAGVLEAIFQSEPVGLKNLGSCLQRPPAIPIP